MLKNKIIKGILLSFVLLFVKVSNAQDAVKAYDINAYVKTMQNTYVIENDENLLQWNTLNARANFKYYLTDNMTFATDSRLVFNYGGMVQLTHQFFADYREMAAQDPGFLDLTSMPVYEKSYMLMLNADRLYLDYSTEKFSVRLGRQRINWGMGLVWNPNDIFNSFSWLDFDYEERPGSDALKLEYYTSYTSSFQFVVKSDRNAALTTAAMYRFNKWNYDFQFLAGKDPDDYILGLGWAGDVLGAGFRGEASYLIADQEYSENTLLLSVDADYTFKNSLYLHIAALYNSAGKTANAGIGANFFRQNDLDVKQLSQGRYALFAQTAFSINPLLNLDVSAIYNPLDHSLFAGPSLNVSIADNWSLLLMTQLFFGEPNTEYGDYGKGIVYLRLKWNF